MTNEGEVLNAAIKLWGMDVQRDQAIEECAELIVALRHVDRGRTGAMDNLIEEMVDTQICLNQLKLMVIEQDFKAEYIRKLLKLKTRIENAGGLVGSSCGKDFQGDSV